MEFHDLEVFISVAKEKSFSKAARSVLRTQPAVSLSIRRLEDELGERLFDRSNKEPILTYEGEMLLEYAEKLLNLRSEIKPAFAEVRNLHRGRVRVGANEIGVFAILNFIGRYHKHYPHVRVEVQRIHTKEIPNALARRNIDMGILPYDIEDPELESFVIHEDYLSFIVHPDHPFANLKKISIQQLSNERFAAHNSKSYYRERVVQMFADHNVTLNIDVELPTIESIKRFVEMGESVAIVPNICVQEELRIGSLIEIEIEELKELKLKRKLQLAFRKGDPLSHVPKAFLRLIQSGKNKQKDTAEKTSTKKGKLLDGK